MNLHRPDGDAVGTCFARAKLPPSIIVSRLGATSPVREREFTHEGFSGPPREDATYLAHTPAHTLPRPRRRTRRKGAAPLGAHAGHTAAHPDAHADHAEPDAGRQALARPAPARRRRALGAARARGGAGPRPLRS